MSFDNSAQVAPSAFPLVISDIPIRRDAEGRYCISDLHKAAVATGITKDIRPAEWMALDQTQGLVEVLIKENPTFNPIASKAGRYGGTFAVKEMIYAYAMWVSPSFHLKVIRTFDAVATQDLAERRDLTQEVTALAHRIKVLESEQTANDRVEADKRVQQLCTELWKHDMAHRDALKVQRQEYKAERDRLKGEIRHLNRTLERQRQETEAEIDRLKAEVANKDELLSLYRKLETLRNQGGAA